jgi:hypothetical protein
MLTKYHLRIEQDIPVIAECDVLVVGGGPGGIGAAVMAARSGAKTILIEKSGILGGMASTGEVHPFMPNHFNDKKNKPGNSWINDNATSMDRPVYLEWIRAIAAYLPPVLREKTFADAEACNVARNIDKNAASLAAEDICLRAGVKLLYHHTLVRASVTERRLDYAVFSSKSGFVAVKAKTYVDSTGDGDLAALAGCGFEIGGPDGNCQPMTLCFKLSNIDRARMPEYAKMQELYQKAKHDGVLDCQRESLLYMETNEPDVMHFNTTRVVGKNGVDGIALSEAEIEGRHQFRQYLEWFRNSVPGFENAQIYSIGQHIGIRETRRINGLARLTREDFIKRSKFNDAIARCNYPIDIHSTSGSGTELVFIPQDEYYEIPYGCIVARDISNLTIGSRCISVDHSIHSSMRVMPVVCSVGQAAGLAAALTANAGADPSKLDGVEIREKLKSLGAWL